MRGWRLRRGWRRCRGCFWFGAFVGRLFLGAVALGVIAWHDGVAFVLAESFFVVFFGVLKMGCKGW